MSHEQVGHICAKDGTASILAPIADYRLGSSNHGGILEAAVLTEGSAYQFRVQIIIVGSLAHKQVSKIYAFPLIPFQTLL